MKYYAVRKGVTPGVYATWPECEANVKGYPGAEYKSFKTLEEADRFVNGSGIQKADQPVGQETKPPGMTLLEFLRSRSRFENGAVAYVDGSFDVQSGHYSCGVVIYYDGAVTKLKQAFGWTASEIELASMRNVAGEIEGAKAAMQWCLDNGVKYLDIHYDYQGIESWCTGAWKTNKQGTIDYKRFYEEASKSVAVTFMKEKGHSGDMGNDEADRLAKEALGLS